MKFQFALLWGSLLTGGASAFSQQQYKNSRTTSTSTSTTKLEALINIDENVQRDIGSMDEYMTNCGVQRAEGFQLTSEDGLDYSVMTTENLPAESPVLSVPANMILSSSEVREELTGYVEPAEEMLEILGVPKKQFAMFHLFLKILIEYEKGDESPWFPWLNSLPRTYSNGASMTRT